MLIAERGASSNTCTSYLNDITNFDKFLSGAETTLEDATTDDIRRYLRHRSEVGANNPTISRNLSVLRQFLNSYKVKTFAWIIQLLMLMAQRCHELCQK